MNMLYWSLLTRSERYICKNRLGDRKCTQFLIKKSAAGQDNCRCHPLKIFDYCSAVEMIGIKGKACAGAKGRCPLVLPPSGPGALARSSMVTSPSESEGVERFSPQTSALFSVRHQYCHWIYFRLQIKAFLSELCSLQRHDHHPVRHLVGVHNAKANSHLSVYILLTARECACLFCI